MRNYASYKFCSALILLSALFLIASIYSHNSSPNIVISATHDCNLSMRSYKLKKSYSKVIKALQNLPPQCVKSIKKVTLTNSDLLVTTLDLIWQ